MRKTVDLKWLGEKQACEDVVEYFIKRWNKRIPVKEVIDAVLADDDADNKWALWIISRLMNRTQAIEWATFSAELVIPIFEEKYPHDNRPRLAIEAAKKVLQSNTRKKRDAAHSAAISAINVAYNPAAYAARAASYASYAASYVAAYAYNAAYSAAASAHKASPESLGIIVDKGFEILQGSV